MRYLVTGGAGFIGSNLAEHLLRAGAEVVILDDFSTGSRENLQGLPDFQLVEGSITDPRVCRRAMAGVNVVFHQAALGSVPRSVADPARTHEVNATGTLNVLIAARDAGVGRFVYASSSSVYGVPQYLPYDEIHPTTPVSPSVPAATMPATWVPWSPPAGTPTSSAVYVPSLS